MVELVDPDSGMQNDQFKMTFVATARAERGGVGRAVVEPGLDVVFDATAGREPNLPSPAHLLTTAFAACTLKNVARFSELLAFNYLEARIEVTSERRDDPPRIARVDWELTVITEDPPQRLRRLQQNLEHFGTVYNTVAAGAVVNGRVVVERPEPGRSG